MDRPALRFHPVALSGLLAGLLLLQGCLFRTREADGGKEYRGFFSIRMPGNPEYLDLDSTYRIDWVPTGAPDGGTVHVALYQEGELVFRFDSAEANDGSLEWLPAASVVRSGYRFGSGREYKIRITSGADTSMWDWSRVFHIRSRWYGSVSFTEPSGAVPVLRYEPLQIRWHTGGDVGDSLRLMLFGYTEPVDESLATVASAQGAWLWDSLPSSVDTGYYRIRAMKLSDPTLSEYGPIFRIAADYHGHYALAYPRDGDYYRAGAALRIAWKAIGLPGRAVRVELRRDGAFAETLADSLAARDTSLTWSVPAGYASSSRYQVKVASLQDTSLSGHSGIFTIEGILPDTYEDDDSLSRAKPILPGASGQLHTLTYRDQDWLTFPALAGKRYVLGVRSRDSVAVSLADSAGTLSRTRSDTALRMLIEPARPGIQLLRIAGTAAPLKTGSYAVFLNAYDTSTAGFKAAFSRPSAALAWTAGIDEYLSWTPDTALFGESVSLRLYYQKTLFVNYGAKIRNTGGYSAWCPQGIHTSTQYRIRISSTSDSGIYGYSPYFRINGITPDFEEPDNSQAAARLAAADGMPYPRTLARNDSDWVRIATSAGKGLSVVTAGLSCMVDAMDAAGNPVGAGGAASLALQPPLPDTVWVRILPAVPGWGSYSLTITAPDP